MKKELSDKRKYRQITDRMKNEICWLKEYYNMSIVEITRQLGVIDRIVGKVCRAKFNNIPLTESDCTYCKSDIDMVAWIQHLSKFYTADDIVGLTGLSEEFVDKYMYDDNIHKVSNDAPITGYDITVEKLIKFRDLNCHVGDQFRIVVGGGYTSNETYGDRRMLEVTVEKKYPFIVQTDKGCFQYFDLYKGTKIG